MDKGGGAGGLHSPLLLPTCARCDPPHYLWQLDTSEHPQLAGAMKQRILSYRTPPCHKRPVIARNYYSAAPQHIQTSTECCLEFTLRLSNVS